MKSEKLDFVRVLKFLVLTDEPKINFQKMLNLNHKKLKVWKRSIELVAELYEITKLLPDHEKFGLVSQLRRAAVSISSNISEGAARKSKLERKRFLIIIG